MYECFNCCKKAVVWDADFDYSDYGLDGEEIIHECHCTNCGANITYYVPTFSSAEFELICPNCGGKEYDSNSLCLECGCRMTSREVQ